MEKLKAIFDFLEMCLRVFSVAGIYSCYGIAKCIREITMGIVMCRYLTTNDLIYDQMK